jgi:Domain of unknown function (DUF4263)
MREDYDESFWADHNVPRPTDPVGLVETFEALINTDPQEQEIQSFLEDNPWLLTNMFAHCHYALPQFSFGGQYRADFILPERSSGGTMWMLVELEPSCAKLLARNGEFSPTVRTAINQVMDWKRWLLNNQDVAKKSRTIGGLGLHDMSTLLCGYIIVGRRRDVTPRYNQLRADILTTMAIQIKTYDSIVEWGRKRATYWMNYDVRMASLIVEKKK